MTLTAALKEQRTSKRFMLVRLTPARFMNDALTLSGGVYSASFPFPVARVERNGTPLTKDGSTPSSNDHYYYDETSQTIYVKLAAAPSDTSAIVVFYYVFLTGHEPRETFETPTDDTTAVREWEPKLASYPRISQSINNLIGGVFSIAASTLQVINADYAFQSYLTDNDSFYQKDVDIWFCIDSVENISKVFTGKVLSLSIDKASASLELADGFYQLQSSAFLGDSTQEAYFLQASDSFPNMNPADNFKPVSFVFGKSRFLYKTFASADLDDWKEFHELGAAAFSYGSVASLDVDQCMKAVCTGYSDTINATSNRVWGLARTSGDFRTLNFGTTSDSLIHVAGDTLGNHAGEAYFKLDPSDTVAGETKRCYWEMNYTSNNSNLQPNDTFVWTNGSNTYHLVVTRVTSTKVVGFIADLAPGSAFTLATSGLQTNQAPALVIFDNRSGQRYIPAYGLDFTYSIVTTSGGNKYMSVTFVDAFETAVAFDSTRNHPNMNFLHPTTHAIGFRLEQDTSGDLAKHETVLQTILEAAGFTVDATTFAAAGAALDVACSFTIPNFDESSYESYLKYCQDLLASTLGYVRMNADQEVEYKLIAAPSPTSTVDTDLILKDSQKVSVEYQDIVSELIASNPHRPDADAIAGTSVTVKSNKSKHLHGIDRRETMTHVLDDISGRLPDILTVRAAPRNTYEFATATEHLEALLGDDLTLSSQIALGGDGSVALKVIALDKDTNNVSLQASDLKDL